jgi:hypothetical protein
MTIENHTKITCLIKCENSFSADPILIVSYLQAGQIDVLRPVSFAGQSDYDTLTWRTLDQPTVNFGSSWGMEDSVAVWFKPPAPCSLIAIRFYPYDIQATCLLDVWDGSHYDGHITSPDSTNEHGWIGGFNDGQWVAGPVLGHSPIGWTMDDPQHHLWGPLPFVVTQNHLGKWFEIPIDASWTKKGVDLGDDSFIISIAYYQLAGNGWGAEDKGTVPYHSFKYYSYGSDPVPDGEHIGWYIHRESVWFEAVVKYGSSPD